MNAFALKEFLHWCYATKKMGRSKIVPQEKVDVIVAAIRMAPTPSGTQPFELAVVTNTDIRSKVVKAAGEQTQITDGSHLLVFAALDDHAEDRINKVVDLNVQARRDLPMQHAYYNNIKTNYAPRDAEVNNANAAHQAYIAIEIALAAAVEQEVDTTPMEGFNTDVVDQILGLQERGLRSVVLMPLGCRYAARD